MFRPLVFFISIQIVRHDFYVIFHSILKEGAISSLKEWLSDSAIGSNPVLRLIAGIIFMHEQDYNEALKHTHSGGTLDLYVTMFTFILDLLMV